MELATSADSTGNEREKSSGGTEGLRHSPKLLAYRAEGASSYVVGSKGENMDRKFYLHPLPGHLSRSERSDERVSRRVHQ